MARTLVILFLFVFGPSVVLAKSQQATIVTDGALVYEDADFDAPVIETLKRGSVYDISKKQKGPFYKIRLKPGMTGWIADTDVRLGVVKLSEPKTEFSFEEEAKKKKRKPFFATRYRGPTFEMVNYVESTMGGDRVSSLPFFGFKWNGFDTLFDGDIYADSNIMFHFGAPSYYSDLTKKSAGGMIVIANFLFQTTLPQSKWHMAYYGFGPLLKYSNFSLDLPNGSKSVTYSAMDLNVGAVFDLGLAFKISHSLSLRTDLKYFWEKTHYFGFGANLGWEF